jgi:N-acetylmuramoyl-L-alanine amidase
MQIAKCAASLVAALLAVMPHAALARSHVRNKAHITHHPVKLPHRPMVVLDPGHGGIDPGCVGPDGTQEKQVVLATALRVQHQLLAARHVQVAMTREADVFVPLEQRVSFAEAHHAALFVSLHANFSPHGSARGAAIYRFTYRASDPGSALLALRENAADLPGSGIDGLSSDVARILASLMRRETWLHSAMLQSSLLQHLRAATTLVPDPARHARFVVLKAPDIPSVLIELGFLSNPQDARRLRDPSYESRVAEDIADGIEAYFLKLDGGRVPETQGADSGPTEG